MELFARVCSFGVYDPRPGTQLHRELSVMQEELARLAREVLAARPLSPETMSREMLERYATLRGLAVPPQTDDRTLRDAVALLMQTPAPRTPAELEAFFAALGGRITLVEQPEMQRVLAEGTIGGLLSSPAALSGLLGQLLPAGLSGAVSLGELDWAMIDRSAVDCAALDTADFTWVWFDQFGHRLFV